MQEKDFRNLLEKYQAGDCSNTEKALLESWYLDLGKQTDLPSAEDIERISLEVKSSLNISQNNKTVLFRRLASAAAVLLIAATAFYIYRPAKMPEIVVKSDTPAAKYAVDPLPGDNRAILTLSDGSSIDLDDAQSGTLATQGRTGIRKTGQGALIYASPSQTQAAAQVLYNTVSTPRGGQYQVTLPDGTKVWLNAASSLRFPTEFSGNKREVSLTGEAYFEVAKNKLKPFLLHISESEVEVLGTHFNVMAYPEEALTTTLLEGSVKFKHGKSEQIIEPGQAARLGSQININEVNTADAVAWKNGMTAFSNADIYSIMRQISRWYDLDVVYPGELPDRKFTGKIPRTARLSKVLKVLELSDINFKIEEKRIIVTP